MFYKHKCAFAILINEDWVQKYAINTKYLFTSSICDDASAVHSCREVKYWVRPPESTVITFCDSFSSSSLTVSICDRDLRHSLLKMSFISGEHSDRTLRHSEMRSTSSSVIGFLGREDLPRCSTVTMISMASATKDWQGQQGSRD